MMRTRSLTAPILATAILGFATVSAEAQDRPATAEVERPNASEADVSGDLAASERTHLTRSAKLRRLRALASQQGDTEKVRRIEALQAKQQQLYERRTAALRDKLGSDAVDRQRRALQTGAAERVRAGRPSPTAPTRPVFTRPNAPRASDVPVRPEPTRPNAPRVVVPDRPNVPNPVPERPNAPRVVVPDRPDAPRPVTPTRPSVPRPNPPTRPDSGGR